jgi:translation initiation factor IF-3
MTAQEGRVFDADGEMLGVLSLSDALAKAEDAGLDLLEVQPNAEPPVCKIIDYGKYRYEQQKKANAARKNQKTVELKELKMRPTIDAHDYQTKMKNAGKFLAKGDKVKFTIRFRGREMAHQNLGMDVLKRIQSDFGDTVKIDVAPKMEGRQMMMIVSPA